MRNQDRDAESGSGCGIRIGMRNPDRDAESGSGLKHLFKDSSPLGDRTK